MARLLMPGMCAVNHKEDRIDLKGTGEDGNAPHPINQFLPMAAFKACKGVTTSKLAFTSNYLTEVK